MTDHFSQHRIEQQAQREMSAFLRATAELFGRETSRQAGESWIQMMCSLEWPKSNHDQFFRQVTVQATRQLLHPPNPPVPQELFTLDHVSK